MLAKIKKQVLLLILVPLLLPLVVGASFLWMKREVAGAVQMQQAVRDVEKNVLGLNQAISHYLLHPEERPRVQFRLLYGRLAESLARLRPETEQERRLITHMQWERETIGTLFPLLTGPEGGPEETRRGPETSEQRERVVGQLLISSEEIWLNSFQLVKWSREMMTANINRVMAVSLVVILFSGALIVTLASFIGRGIVGTQRDLEREIAERRQAEEALQKAREELEERVAERTRQLREEIEERQRTEESLRETQEELRLLSSKILTGQEKERRRIAGELHDHIWQILNRIVLESNQFSRWTAAGDPAAVRRTAEIIGGDAREAIVKIRSLQGELWPSVLDDLGILATLNWYLREFAREQAGLELEKQIEVSEAEVPPDLRIVIYRVLQESLKNVARHSGAGRVRVALKKEKGKIEFTVEDDGRGFDLKQVLFGSATWLGLGLVSIKEKVEQSGGAFEVVSRPGAGTILRASWQADEVLRKIAPTIPRGPLPNGLEGRVQVVSQALSDWMYAFRVEADGRVVPEWITPGFTKVTGYTFDDILDKGDLYWDLVPEDRPLGEDRFRTIQAAEPYRGEFRVVAKNGAVLWIRDYCNPVADPFRPGTIKVMGAAHDITDRKQAENLLQAQHDLLLAVAEMRTLPETLDRCLETAISVSGMDSGGFYLADETGGLLLAGSRGLPEAFVAAVRAYPAEAAQTRLVMAGKAVYSRQADLTLPWPAREAGDIPALRAISILPLRQGTQIVGCLNVASHTLDEVPGPGRVALETIASTIGLLLGRMRAEEALRDSEERFRLFMNHSPTIAWMKDELGRYVYLSKTLEERFDIRLEDWNGKTDEELWPPEVADEFRKNDQAALAGERPLEAVEETVDPDGSRCYWLISKFPFGDAAGNRFVAGIGLDITERKQAEAGQALLTDILRLLNRGGDPHPVMAETLRRIREATGFEAVGLRLRRGEEYPYFEHNGFSAEFVEKENFLCAKNDDGSTVRDAAGPVLECTCGLILSERTDPEMPYFTPGGSFWTNVSSELLALTPETDPRTNPRNRCIHAGYESVGLFPIPSGESIIGLLQLNDCRAGRFTLDSINFFETLTQNIGLALQRVTTEEALRESEKRLRASLGEKEALLKEVHHRVKNNLQVISSLMSLQSEETRDAGLRAVFQEVNHRVRSMALVHEQLYQSADLARVDFAAYARSLLTYLWQAYGAETAGIRLTLNLEPLSLSVYTAVPLGLILNELAGNALKHAFHDRTGGEVRVSLQRGPADRVQLTVSDDGRGLPEGFDWGQARSLGLRLVRMLAGQLHADVAVSREEGTEFGITLEVKE